MIGKYLTSLALGSASWSLLEHLVHNGLGHKFARNRNFFAVEHVRHHATTSYFAPPGKKIGITAIAGSVIGAVSCRVLGRGPGLAFTAGLTGTYALYEWLHHSAHVRAPRTAYGRWLCKHHFHHHFRQPNMNHGVTSPIWDLLFNTYEKPGVIPVPERHAMPWLLDPTNGKVRAEFADDYKLVRKRVRPATVSP